MIIERKKLIHAHPGMPMPDFMAAIDATGGWPIGYAYVQFYHSGDNAGRYCIFTNNGTNTGWWSTVCTADDYYWWKLSDNKKAAVMEAAREQLIRQLR